MQAFYQDFGVIISFLVMTLLIGMIGGNKVTKYFLYLVLAGMVIFNGGKFVSAMNNSFTTKEV